jgi:branched-chain amino acid transport system substrate-binding protein
VSSAQEQFRVGVIAPLSGALAEYGQAARNGIELARSQNPEMFSGIEFSYEDSQWDAKAAVSAFYRLRDASRVSLVFNWGNPTTEAVAPLAERYQMPLIGMTLDPIVSRGKSYVIRSTNSASDFSGLLAHHLERRGYQKIGVILADNTYVQGLFDGLRAALDRSIQIEIVDRYNIQDQDFRGSISKIRAKKFDAIGVFLISGQVSNFYRQLQSQSVTLPTFGTDFFESSTEIKLANGGMTGAVYPHLGVSESFRNDYVTRFGNDYQLAYAGNAYDMAVIIGRLFNSADSLSSEQIMERLRSVQNQPGVGGVFSFSSSPHDDPHFQFPVMLKQIDGEVITNLVQ